MTIRLTIRETIRDRRLLSWRAAVRTTPAARGAARALRCAMPGDQAGEGVSTAEAEWSTAP